jgi:epoxyqueuosine reductase QueG
MKQTEKLKAVAKDAGADSVGIADLALFKTGWPVVPHDLLGPYINAVSIAVRLDNTVIDSIEGGPTAEYARHYREVNASLDGIAACIVTWIKEMGFTAYAVPASYIADENNLLGNISHKAVARLAGIGWQGKSLLIIHPQYGPRIRLATVLTGMPLEPDEPMKNMCGTCAECSKACPASAIKNVSTKDRYESRDDALYFSRCVAKTIEFSALPGIGARVCGVCIKACPFGKKRRAAISR